MSSHRISASGDRPYTLQAGGGALTALQVPAKATDGAQVTIGGAGRVEIQLSNVARVERRLEQRRADTEPVETYWLVIEAEVPEARKEDGSPYPRPGVGATVFVSAPDQGNGTLHTNVDVRKHEPGGWPSWYLESSEVQEAHPVVGGVFERVDG